ncbi:MAG: VWA domain-containing protein [Parvularculaceae bacterium]|nr:VWA domain-containing protein [Parvularculaceae bacterium]
MTIRNFLADRSGNIAIMFGIMFFMILAAVGAAIDVQRSNSLRTEIAEASDAAIIAAARYKSGHPNANAAVLTGVARKVFDNELGTRSAIDIKGFTVSFDKTRDTFVLDVSGEIKTLIMGVLGHRYVDIDMHPEAKLGKPPLLEVAMALDVTGSMNQHGKITTMKNAARDLVKTLFEKKDADVKIGVVPFAQYISVGAAYKNASWLSFPGYGWTGCIGSRDYPYNTQDTDYATFKAPGLLGAVCPASLMPLSRSESALDSMISGLKPGGWTYIPAGLSGAWMLLTPNAPFDEALTFEELEAERGTKALILMTDGENTRAPDYPTHNSTSEQYANDLTEETCANIKNQEIVVYTIAFEVTDTTIKDILEQCATTTGHYFDAANSGDLVDAFASIANSLRNISLSK